MDGVLYVSQDQKGQRGYVLYLKLGLESYYYNRHVGEFTCPTTKFDQYNGSFYVDLYELKDIVIKFGFKHIDIATDIPNKASIEMLLSLAVLENKKENDEGFLLKGAL